MIRTARLLLRPVRPQDDLAAMHGIMRQPRAMAYWSTPPHGDEAATAEFLGNMAEIPLLEGEDFIVEHESRVIGKAGFYRFPDLGYMFDPTVWGQGFAREAVGAVVARGFTVHHLPRIQADVDPRNKASIRLLERLGFTETHRAARTWLVGEEWCDSVYFALTREEWDQRIA
ncbi:GNAT family N-acetyltransferase [Novosphingobium jiangmenense]|uniref:GNAT family N-acetyltransferase n=1 Tax=Novosphingobium jiangmenense TaxID=2791981 RepID=A0ABS0HHA3_9SPHN|nr:GNAT family N-acetyltransferase [Novosphingobium jiangmenense]MBF9151643.1 GNAT family N-acetyltransferase [Novosphingobium jiangmenense]